MVDAVGSGPATIYICDRNYASYNNFVHVIENGQYFLIRCTDKKTLFPGGFNYFYKKVELVLLSCPFISHKNVSMYIRPDFDSYNHLLFSDMIQKSIAVYIKLTYA